MEEGNMQLSAFLKKKLEHFARMVTNDGLMMMFNTHFKHSLNFGYLLLGMVAGEKKL